MKKKKYVKPTMQVVKIQPQVILQTSGKRDSYGPAHEG